MATRATIEGIRDALKLMVGSTVMVETRYRGAACKAKRVLEGAHPNVFTVAWVARSGAIRRESYTYADVLTGAVRVSVCPKDDKEEKAV